MRKSKLSLILPPRGLGSLTTTITSLFENSKYVFYTMFSWKDDHLFRCDV